MELPLPKRKKHYSALKVKKKKKKGVILVYTQAGRSMKLNGYPRNRPKCARFII